MSNNCFDNHQILCRYSDKLLFNVSQLNVNFILRSLAIWTVWGHSFIWTLMGGLAFSFTCYSLVFVLLLLLLHFQDEHSHCMTSLCGFWQVYIGLVLYNVLQVYTGTHFFLSSICTDNTVWLTDHTFIKVERLIVHMFCLLQYLRHKVINIKKNHKKVPVRDDVTCTDYKKIGRCESICTLPITLFQFIASL